jgi:hypothetical protein
LHNFHFPEIPSKDHEQSLRTWKSHQLMQA